MAHEHTVHEWGFWAVSCGFLRYWDEWMLIIWSDHLFLGDFRLSGSKDEEARLFNDLRNHACVFAFCCCMCVHYIWLYVHLFAYHTMHLHFCYWHQVLVGNTSEHTILQPQSSIRCYKYPQSMNHLSITHCISLLLLITSQRSSNQFLTFQCGETPMATRWICPATWRSFAPDADGGHSALLAVRQMTASRSYFGKYGYACYG